MCVSGWENFSWSKSLKLRNFVAVTSLSDVAHKCNITQNRTYDMYKGCAIHV